MRKTARDKRLGAKHNECNTNSIETTVRDHVIKEKCYKKNKKNDNYII